MSPPVYPSPDVNATGMGNWTDAITKAAKAVSQMTLVEKLSLTVGSPSNTSCSGTIPPIARLGFPGMCLSDASNGLRGTDLVSSFSSGIHVGARALALERATALGNEFKTKGVNVLLGPVVGPLGRVVTGGRLWEGFSIDPYLSGAMVGETVQGIQNVGVVACVKHYIANEQETNRQPENQVAASSSNIDDQTMHEFYLWPFQDAVKAGAGSIMCSYNRLNNSYGCANSQSLNGLLKTELGFKGFVVTDWGAQHAGVATALAGLDMAMPEGYGFWGSELATAVQNGSVPEARITDMATRVMATWYQMHQDVDFPVPGVGMPLNLINPHPIVDGRNKSEQQVLLDSAIEGHVLVKNSGGALPLRSPRMLSIFGYSAKTPDTQRPGDGSVLDSFTYGTESVDSVQFLLQFSGLVSGQYPVIAPNGTIFSGGGSGATAPSNGVSPFEAIKSRARVDGTAVYWDLNSPSPPVDPGSDACLVFGNSWASEGYDRPALRDDFTDGLILAVAGQCNNTIVVLHNAGPRLVDQFIDHPNVTALIFAHLPGQESGPAVSALLYGDANPSGKLPYTVAHNESDYGGLLAPDQPTGIFINFPQSNYSEGSVLDYRRFDLLDIIPRYPFGYGLSYTTFGYTDMSIEFDPAAASAEYPSGLVQPGGQADLFDVLVTASARVTNTGLVAGAEVAQLYISLPSTKLPGVLLKPTGPRLLRGFAKPVLSPAGSAELSFALTRRDLSVWDVTAQRWRLLPGLYRVFVGSSSRNLPLQGNFTI